MHIDGHCDPRFISVRKAFETNFRDRGEVGGSVCIMLHGKPVVDLWGGYRDPTQRDQWREDTLVVVMSCTKGAVALCGHLLAERGLLDMNASVASYWPEFAANGKAKIPVRQLFSHQSGLVHVKGRIPVDGFCDWNTIIRLIEQSSPFWQPGTRVGYHALTHGYLIGELVRRITGKSVGRFFREEVAEPLGLDFWIGLPPSEHRRVARVIPVPADDNPPLMMRLLDKLPQRLLPRIVRLLAPNDLMARAITNLGGFLQNFDSPRYYEAENPSAGGITNARGLAGLYAPLANGGSAGSYQLLQPATIAGMRYAEAVTDCDAFLGGRSSFTLGFSKSWANRDEAGVNSVIIGEDAFGTPGFGGNIGFADPHYGLSFGYTMNQQGAGTGLNERGQSLVDATYRALGAAGNTAGFWARPDSNQAYQKH